MHLIKGGGVARKIPISEPAAVPAKPEPAWQIIARMTPTDLKRLADLLFPQMSQQIDARIQARAAPGTPGADRIKLEKIVETVAQVSNCKMNVMLSRQRSRPLVRLRWVAALIMRTETRASLPEIARALGLRDHTTLVPALKSGPELLETDAGFRDIHTKALALLQANEGVGA